MSRIPIPRWLGVILTIGGGIVCLLYTDWWILGLLVLGFGIYDGIKYLSEL
jgi:hypothetical protein